MFEENNKIKIRRYDKNDDFMAGLISFDPNAGVDKDRFSKIAESVSGNSLKISFDPNGSVDKDRISKVAENVFDSSLDKVAGIFIDNPTEENIEDFVKKYIYNELAFFPRILEVNVLISPDSFNREKEGFVEDATGVVSIKIHDKIVELPFMISKGELDPFDVIQLDGQRVPFTRENLKKILLGIEAMEGRKKNGENVGSTSPFLGTEDYFNPSTSAGFLTPALAIRDTNTRRFGGSGGHYVTAADSSLGIEKTETNIDDMLEKSVNLKPLTEKQIESITYCINKAARDKFSDEIEKLAAEEKDSKLTREERKALENKTFFTNISSFKNGDYITFPYRQENDISMAPGIVLELSSSVPGVEGGKKINNKMKVVMTTENNYLPIKKGMNFLCKKSNNESFKLRSVEISKLSADSKFILGSGSEFSPIFKIEKIDAVRKAVTESGKNKIYREFVGSDDCGSNVSKGQVNLENLFTILACVPVGVDEYFLNLSDKSTVYFVVGDFDTNRIVKINSPDDISQISKKVRMVYDNNYRYFESILSKYQYSGRVYAVDLNTKVIPVMSKIKGYFESQAQYENMDSLHTAGYNLMGLEKLAADTNKIRVICTDRKNEKYNLSFDYKDTSKRLFRMRRQQFSGISKEKLKVILRLLKYNPKTINDIVFKAKNEPSVSYPISADCTIEDINKIENGNIINLSAKNTKEAISDAIGADKLAKSIALAIPAALTANAISTTVRNNPDGTLAGVLKNPTIRAIFGMKKRAKELSQRFEKYASENDSYELLDIAKMFAIEHNMLDKIAESLDSDNIYPGLFSLSKEVSNAKPVLEKFAYDLIGLKIDQQKAGIEKIGSIEIQSAVESLDELYKIAYSISENADIDHIKFVQIKKK